MRLLIIGTGNMANGHANTFSQIDGIELVGAVDVRPEILADFCTQHNIAKQFPTLQAALDWGEFDAATVVTPDAVHKEATLPLLAAGKNVLCEKPLAPNYADAKEMADAAEHAGTIAMVNLTYRGVKELTKARELVQAGEIGEVRHVEASYLQSWLAQDAWGKWNEEPTWLWRLSSKHGSLGVLGDIGVHLIDFLCFGTDQEITSLTCNLRAFPKADNDQIDEYILDANDSAVMNVRLTNGALGVVHASRWASGHVNDLRLRIFGTHGGLEINHIHTPASSSLKMCRGNDNLKAAAWAEVVCPAVPTSMERFANAVLHGGEQEPSFAYTARLQQVLDAAFTASETGTTQLLTN